MYNDLLFSLASMVLALPRIIVPLLWMFARWFLTNPFTNWWWILFGFLFAPFTLLLYCGWYQFANVDFGSWQWAILLVLGIIEVIYSTLKFKQAIWVRE
ncbi:MAG TPA: hypothetical protein PLH65_02040 [bacterium]|nr:hypothetical protein [bacterium]HPN67504.1 hypothetical protein [bacterium]